MTDASRTNRRPRLWPGALKRSSEIRILAVALILSAYFETANHDFLLTSASLENLSQFIAPVAIIAFGEIMLMIGGEIDLSSDAGKGLTLTIRLPLSQRTVRMLPAGEGKGGE